MRMTIESTGDMVQLGDTGEGRARRWVGHTDSGIPVIALIAGLSPQTHDLAVATRFATELEETAAPPREVTTLDQMISGPVLAALASRPPSRENVLAVLEALAIVAATVIVGTEAQMRDARDAFVAALDADIAGPLLRPENRV